MDETAMTIVTYVLVAFAFFTIGYSFGHKDGYWEGHVHGLMDAINVYQRYREAMRGPVDEEGGDD